MIRGGSWSLRTSLPKLEFIDCSFEYGLKRRCDHHGCHHNAPVGTRVPAQPQPHFARHNIRSVLADSSVSMCDLFSSFFFFFVWNPCQGEFNQRGQRTEPINTKFGNLKKKKEKKNNSHSGPSPRFSASRVARTCHLSQTSRL